MKLDPTVRFAAAGLRPGWPTVKFAAAGLRPGWPTSALLLLASAVGCTTVLGVDGDYVPKGSGGSGSGPPGGSAGVAGAVRGAGGTLGVGGAGGAGGSAGRGGSSMGGSGGGLGTGGTDAPSCSPDQKLCTVQVDGGSVTECFQPSPLVGCSLQSCERCPVPPENAVVLCKNNQCGFECIPGYTVDTLNGRCVPAGSGGASGTGGSATGGTGGSVGCVEKACPTCNPAGPFRCCKANQTCGCTWAPGAVCY